MKILKLIIFLLICLTVASCGPQTTMLVVKDSPILGVKDPTIDKITQAILHGCEYAGWKPQKLNAGLIRAVFHYEGHEATVDIKFTTESYNISHHDSKNLNHEDNLIHPRFNRWLIRLDRAIRNATLKLR